MSAVATLPRNGGNGAALVVIVADLLIKAYGALTAKPAPKAKTVAAAAVKSGAQASIWRLYRLAANGDSVNPKVFASLSR
jgi:hypothetical protein